ncbi:hypothetical protein SEVIR_1G128000v4 [Setaria viridis]|uniref:Uncharacterized protein n=2 Tax=Setaria TaxID=4554 RepID=K3YXX8_SETIT|nr:probable pectinesterase/pectinesterase inhibitor 34 [Setaria italica]XP_034582678.1 probable pectinesterase/pectinesterase inhibitor 34 [Setaria viridis]RCV06016.1 hypothetical protein SETIT_1G129700v2 [Setaria italica]TKW38630.1 hypothetical protein SEVIR_1G128000v2 [Setaria viridis]
MDHRRAGSPLLLLALLLPSCFLVALLLAGCGSVAHAAPRPVFAFPAAAKVQASSRSHPRHERLRVALDAAAARVGQALAAMVAAAAVDPASSDDAPASTRTPLAAAAREDCAELLEEALALLAGAGAAARDDALTWLSAALTNHDTCADGLAEAGAVAPGCGAPHHAHAHLAAARAAVRDSLAMYDASTAVDTAATRTARPGTTEDGCHCNNETRREGVCGFPRWLPARDRRLLLTPAASLAASADIVVAKDGTGTHATITDAVKAAPECSERRTVILVKAGRYEENVKVGMRKTNLVFVGDGKGVTVVAGTRSVADRNYTTFRTATFAASGFGFMMRDMTVENASGPARHQAVALRVSADRAVVHRCAVAGYQDTLYAHSNRQFYRDCDVYGTVDAVFGNAAAVLQRCTLWARAPLSSQKNTVTAQNRNESCQRTGIVLHACRLLPAPDLLAAPSPSPALSPSPAPAQEQEQRAATYLGRPWRPYSRVVVMMSYIGAHVAPRGWLEWNASAYALDTLYYGEYMNYGPGAGVAGRVRWPGHRVINDTEEAERFTVARFIAGASWLPATGVSFVPGLSL